jgi:DNA modification methylase
MNGHQPNLMVTDPPYGVDYEAGRIAREIRKEKLTKREKQPRLLNDKNSDWFEAYNLFPGNILYIWHSSQFADVLIQGINDSGFEIKAQIIWVKNVAVLSHADYHQKHEPCFYAVKKGAKHNWQGGFKETTIWEIPSARFEKDQTDHPTQKPLECMARPIQNNSKPNDYVYDPFCGSGTTLIACEKLGRRCLTQELDPKYVDMTIARWEKFTGQKAILESTGEEFDV